MNNSNSNFDFVCVGGFGRSGSSACVDLLKEFEYVDGPDNEFRVAKDPCGILDLELSVVDNWEFVRHNTAINDFLKYCLMVSREDGLFKRTGKGFSEILNVDFMHESIAYINRVNNFTYQGDTMLNRYHLNALQSFKQRIKSKFKLSNAVPMYFSRPSEDKFITETNRYFRNIFRNYAKKNKIRKIILDQAISPVNISKTIRYFCNAKMIVVDRDPRDIYAAMIDQKMFLGVSENSVTKYITWHREVRRQAEKDINNKVLRLNFEDFFLNYKETIESIKDFLDIDFKHSDKGLRFQPESIDKHVGIWRKVLVKNDALLIEKELGSYCYIKE